MVFVTWKEPTHSQFLTVKGECQGVRYANLWAHQDPDRQRVSNQVFFTYYQQLCVVVASRPRITKDVTDMYKKRVCFMADLHHIYIKPRGVKTKDWYTGSYRMVQANTKEIIKEWPEEWKNPNVNHSDSEECSDNETSKGKNKCGEDKGKEKQSESEKRSTSQEEPILYQRKKRKATQEPYELQLS